MVGASVRQRAGWPPDRHRAPLRGREMSGTTSLWTVTRGFQGVTIHDHGLRGQDRRGDRPGGQPRPEPGRDRARPGLGDLPIAGDTGRTYSLRTLVTG